MKISIRNGHLLDPANQIDQKQDLFIADGRVVALKKAPDGFKADIDIDADNQLVCPGLIDLSVHLPEPGREHKGTIDSELKAAVSGGVTTLCCQPDTQPILDNPAVAELIHQRTQAVKLGRILPLAALTKGLENTSLTDMNAMKEMGCVGVSNANIDCNNAEALRRAMEYAASCDMTVHLFCEDPALKNNGVLHEGGLATRLGLPAIPYIAETLSVSRALLLAAQTGASLHLSRITCAESVSMIQSAKQQGLPVTADTSVVHLHLNTNAADGFNAQCHLDPPLRDEADRLALIKGIKEGVLDAVCSDHRPHDRDAKRAPFSLTEPGASNIEHLCGLMFKLLADNQLDRNRIIAALTHHPARIIDSELGQLSPGATADICIISETEQIVGHNNMLSHGKNTPFTNWILPVQVTHTLVDGRLVHQI